MAQIVIYDPLSTPVANRVTGYYPSEDETKFPTPNKLVFHSEPASITALKAARTPWSQCVRDGSDVREMTQAEKDAVTAADAAAALAALKAAIADLLTDGTDAQKKGLRICFEVVIELFVAQLNTLRQNPTTTYAALTESAVKTAFYNAITAKVAAIT